MTASELLLWFIVMFPLSILFSSALGIISLNYHRILYGIDSAKFYVFYQDLRFPFDFYRRKDVAPYVTLLNRAENKKSLAILRLLVLIFLIIFFIVPAIFLFFRDSEPLIEFLLFIMVLAQCVVFFLSWGFGRGLDEL